MQPERCERQAGGARTRVRGLERGIVRLISTGNSVPSRRRAKSSRPAPFGSQRALKTVEDFTEFEQRAAYFDGDPTTAAKKGVNPLESGSQVHFMSEFQEILDFPPAPKLDVVGRLDPGKASESELRGQAVFFGKGQCAACHTPPYYTDNLMHNLRTERFFAEKIINGRKASADGLIKTFPLRGIKDSPPYLHDDRLMTLDDTVEFFNVVLGLKLATEEKADLVAFLRAL
jgi:cytochrome c peroxidase